ncbi:hypothetical protein ATCC90586_008668 [Pythium insidiosum]|nr:hypothetical protein ATCC90586_008668 [Pythium insidiosum]
MVRRASKLPPNATTVEEVLVRRLTSEGTDHRRQTSASSGPVAPVVSPPSALMASVATASASEQAQARLHELTAEFSQLEHRFKARHEPPERAPATDMSPQGQRQHRQLDGFIQRSVTDATTHYGAQVAESRKAMAAATGLHATRGSRVTHSVRELRSTVRRLDRVFYEVATGDKQRHLAATKIASVIRCFLWRRRYLRLRLALGEWRARRCHGFLLNMEQFSAREEFLQRQFVRLESERTQRLLRRVLAELRDVTLLNLPLRRRRLEETERRLHSKQRTLLLSVFAAWKRCALGPTSRKKATQAAKQRHAAARQRLEALERFDVITAEMVHEEFLKENIRIVRSRHPLHVLRTFFTLLKTVEYLPMRANWQRAVAHDRRVTLSKCWKAWLPLFRASQVDRQLARLNERRTLERFEPHHNLRRVDAHYRATHLRKHLRAWAAYGQRLRRVRRLFEDTTRANLGGLVRRWHARADYQRQLRAHAVEQWRAYCRRVFQTPFRAWYVYAAQRRAQRSARESICVAYQRRQRRHTKYTFFRLWKHQVLFGSIEGIHSRLHLLRSLEDQKRLCLGLEANARRYEENIAALRQSIELLERHVTDKQRELLALHDATQATRFALHTAEQGIARVQGMLEAVRQVHPGTVARIERLFDETPLLTQDLQDVVALHVRRRQEVLQKIALDETELEVQAASEGGGGAAPSRSDQLLLHRIKWVLSRLDLHQTSSSPSQPVDQLCALFEFIRSGETALLSRDNDPSHPRRSSDPQDEQLHVDRQDVVDRSLTWHRFVEALTVKFAPQRMLQLQERLVLRAKEMDDELDVLKRNPHVYNAYSGSRQPPPEKCASGEESDVPR